MIWWYLGLCCVGVLLGLAAYLAYEDPEPLSFRVWYDDNELPTPDTTVHDLREKILKEKLRKEKE